VAAADGAATAGLAAGLVRKPTTTGGCRARTAAASSPNSRCELNERGKEEHAH
jgi:hypothetical protein